MSKAPVIHPSHAASIVASKPEAILLDVRTPAEFTGRHAVGALNIPLDGIPSKALSGEHSFSRDQTICILCEKGGRAAIAAELLAAEGCLDVHVVEGGIQGWVAAGLPVISSGRKSISIERQVRIGAGSLVLLGVILGFLLNPGFFALSAFIGAGLVFAGITDWCGMGLLLARAPWNR
jgi:rhodanese-related sulfurtransferase